MNNKWSHGRNVFQQTGTIFELVQDIIGTNLLTKKTFPPPGGHKTHNLTKFHEDWTQSVTSRVFTYINKINVLTKFHDDWTKNVTSKVFTRNTAPPPSDWASNVTSTVFTSFKLSRGINRTNVLIKFHEDRTINVASGVFTRQMLTAHDARRTTDKGRSQKLTMSTLC
ncbi:hypothetical protein DPMN_147877 [Dreissena polymorpha]|uniref:Uncharacterized protein n=1 Tax=Dreissena polymorpha TaxID=45954 RepID=A0A9D4J108_DREPO|nr:hypothetical protein DPMN_147877 [Dreissena polymorpha]